VTRALRVFIGFADQGSGGKVSSLEPNFSIQNNRHPKILDSRPFPLIPYASKAYCLHRDLHKDPALDLS